MSTAPATSRAFRALSTFFALAVGLASAGCAGGGYTPLLLPPSEDPFFFGHDSGAFLGHQGEPIPW